MESMSGTSSPQAGSSPPIRLTVENRIASLLLDAPPRNDLDLAAFAELARLGREVFPFLDVDGMIVSGRGRHFSSGAKVEELKAALTGDGRAANLLRMVENTALLTALERLPFPVVAVIRGCCFGVGLELALACHFRAAIPNAVFALPEAGFGLLPGCGGTVRLPALAGRGRATELILSGRTVGAEEAYAMGLVDCVVGKEELLPLAERFIHSRAWAWRTAA
jgi:enoyl-CoA hydratase/carnithine racemase